MTKPALAAAVGELCEHQHWCVPWWCSSSASSPPANSVRATLHAAVQVPSQTAEGIIHEMRRQPKAALFVQLSLTEDCPWQSMGHWVPSTAGRTPVPVRSRLNPKGWGVQCAGILQVSKTVRGFSRLALFALVRMGRSVSQGEQQSPDCSRAELQLLRKLHLFFDISYLSGYSSMILAYLRNTWSSAALCSLLLQLCVWVADEGWQKGKRAERCNPPAELFPEVTVKMTAGDSPLVLCPSLSDETLLSSHIRRWFF